jgi:hypothetical protein
MAGIILWLAGVAPGWALNWYWSNPLPHGNDVADMVYFNGLIIQVTDLGQLYTSDDLQLWSPRVTNTTNSLQSAAVFGNQLIVTGASGTVLYSTDGVNYTYTNLATSDWLVAVAASPNLAVAVGDNAAIYTSADGAHWTRQAPPPGVGGNWLQGVAYGAGTFVTVGDSGYVAVSSNGTNWTKVTTGASGDLTYVGWINTPTATNAFSITSFIAVSDAGEIIISTNNGASWTFDPGYTTTTNVLYTVAGNADSRLVAGDGQMNLERLLRGTPYWPSQLGAGAGSALSWTYFCSLCVTNLTNEYLVSGATGLTIGGTQSGTNYSWAQLDDSNRSWLWQVTTNAGLYVAVGDNASIMTSDDGVTWDTEALPLTNGVSVTNTVLFGVGGNSNQLVAVGNGGTIVLSTNQLTTVVSTNADGSLSTNTVSTIGVIWNPIPPPTTNDLQSVAFFGNNYYVAGGNGTILQSPDGVNWTPKNSTITAYLSGLAVYSNGIVAVGDLGKIIYSTDGTTWNVATSGTTNWVFRVRCLGGNLIAVGENGTILTSSNGTLWTSRTSGTTNWLNDVSLVTNIYFIVGDAGTVLGSTNLITWTNVPTITGESLYGAATQSGQLLVVGDSGVIIRSEVVPEITQLQFLDFQTTPNEAVFLVAPTNAAVDLQFTLDSSTNLPNWTTGPLLDLTSGALFFYIPFPSNPPPNQVYRATLLPQ